VTLDPFVRKNARIFSNVIFAFLLVSIAGLIYTNSLLGHGPVAIGLQTAAILLMIWARVTFGVRSFHYTANPTEGGLVTAGPYRYVRHPIYSAILLFVWTGAAANLTPLSVLLATVVTAMLALRIALEEPLVRQRYPEYADYARRTKRVVPFLF
jgi:protein-S-isoprenylcysteine O-methyltransferase Ste14